MGAVVPPVLGADPVLDLLRRAEEACRDIQREAVNITTFVTELRKARASGADAETVGRILTRGDVSLPPAVARMLAASAVLQDTGPRAIAAVHIEIGKE